RCIAGRARLARRARGVDPVLLGLEGGAARVGDDDIEKLGRLALAAEPLEERRIAVLRFEADVMVAKPRVDRERALRRAERVEHTGLEKLRFLAAEFGMRFLQ